jgi:uncharacterized protein YidB (DUF937 family)
MDLIDILRRKMEERMGIPPQAQGRSGGGVGRVEDIHASADAIERDLGVGRGGSPSASPRQQPADPRQQQAPPTRGKPDDVLGEILDTIKKRGGVGDVVDDFRKTGSREQADSWVRRGPNQPVSRRQVEDAIGRDALERAAKRLGIPYDMLADAFSDTVPEVVDHSTPDGEVSPKSGSLLDQILDQLRRAQ